MSRGCRELNPQPLFSYVAYNIKTLRDLPMFICVRKFGSL